MLQQVLQESTGELLPSYFECLMQTRFIAISTSVRFSREQEFSCLNEEVCTEHAKAEAQDAAREFEGF